MLFSKYGLTSVLKTCICLCWIVSWEFVTLAVQPCCQHFWSICYFIHCGLLWAFPPFIFHWNNPWHFHLNLFWFLPLYLLKVVSHFVASDFAYCHKNVPDHTCQRDWCIILQNFVSFHNIRKGFIKSIIIDRFSSAMNKNRLYKNILGFEMLSQININRMCVAQPQQHGKIVSFVFWAFVFSLIQRKMFRLLSLGKTIEFITHNFR